ncbi:MAG: hypothetical protein M0C28_07930 [Candidatus Moduliflexus flocculans]|nr:hypothetical protein [Candidatus Moduliflexus flocculans]
MGFAYGGSSPAYHAANDSLFVVGHVYDQMTAEIAIPQPVVSSNLDDLATAPVLQQFHDALEGSPRGGRPGRGERFRVGGQLASAGRLYLSDYTYYDADTTQVTSHFSRPLDLSVTGQLQGPYQVGTAGAGFVSGYMASIPRRGRAARGPALTGNCCISIISRTSCGPAAAVFDPTTLGSASPAPATLVVGYPLAHPTLGTWEGTGVANPVYNMGTTVRGLVFPEGTQSVLFFGRTGLGVPCYGTGGASGGTSYDPVDSSKGTHAYPYALYVWAYDAADLTLAKNGTKQPWEVVPYAHWALDLPLGDDSGSLGGAAYDPASQRIFLAQSGGDAYGSTRCRSCTCWRSRSRRRPTAAYRMRRPGRPAGGHRGCGRRGRAATDGGDDAGSSGGVWLPAPRAGGGGLGALRCSGSWSRGATGRGGPDVAAGRRRRRRPRGRAAGGARGPGRRRPTRPRNRRRRCRPGPGWRPRRPCLRRRSPRT